MPIDIESLIPHRDRMKLIDCIVSVDHDGAVTESVVSQRWPMAAADGVSATVLVELVAQTAGVNIGWLEQSNNGDPGEGKGWLVGVKRAVFKRDPIPLGSRLTVHATKRFSFENLSEITAVIKMDGRHVADISLQVMQSETTVI